MYLEYKDKKIDTRIDTVKADIFAGMMLTKLGGRANYMKLMKLLYLADRYHLRTYMRPIAFDDYFAMKKGVIGSYWLDLLRGKIESRFFVSDKQANVKMKTSIGEKIESLSASELEALNFALNSFSEYSEYDLVDIIHEYPEWKKYAGRFDQQQEGREDVEIRDLLNDPVKDNPTFERLKFSDPFIPLSKEEKELIFEEIADFAIESI
jgi:uncharacterized phage-associated protein